jgi:peptidoglycan/LPS O-acetylase OafA/YrhL
MNDRFENINLLRAFAAIAVVVYHVIEVMKWSAFPIGGPLLTFRIGWIGVDLFFVISGFVITRSALALYRRDVAEFGRRYWARRLSRIVPLYVLTGALWIVLFMPAFFDPPAGHWLWQLASHLTFTHTFWPRTHSSIDGVNWTLAIEMQFYLGVALLVPWLTRTPGWRIWLGCILIAWAWRGGIVYFFGNDDHVRLFMRLMQLPGVVDEFGAGIFLAKLLDRRPGGEKTVGWVWLATAIATGTACISIYLLHTSYWDEPAMVIFWRTLLGAFLLCVVAAAVRLPAFAEMWPFRPVRYLGEISYGIYLWHPFALEVLRESLGITPLQALGITLGVTILMAATSWQFFEKPILDRGRRLGAGRSRHLKSVTPGLP